MRAVVIGSGIGGLACALRLAAAGWQVTVLERNTCAGGRAMVRRHDGFVFDMGPTVLTVPHFIEELFALEPGRPGLDGPDAPPLPGPERPTGGSGGPASSRYVDLVPILPFYRIFFDDGTWFDYDGDPERTVAQVRAIEPADVEGYHRFHRAAKAIFERGFLELGHTHFGDLGTMLAVVPDLLRLDAVRGLFSFTSRFFTSPKLRQVFSFETLLVGGNPLRVPAIYAMIHFVEKTWGIHFARGGTGALVAGFVRKLEELGGSIRLGADVARIEVDDGAGGPAARWTRRVTRGVTLADGEVLPADLVVCNGDWARSTLRLLRPEHRPWTPDRLVHAMHLSMSLVVVYFGFRAPDRPLDLQHHNILLGPRYEELLGDIFDRKVLADDFSQYLHLPTLTDPSLAPPGHHAAYTLVPVPHLGAGIDWDIAGPRLVEAVLTHLEARGTIPDLRKNLVTKSFITPTWFDGPLDSHLGNAFGVEPRLTQSAWFRPHNRSRDLRGLYFVGASVQPGAGTPSVMMSAKMTARLIAEDLAAGRLVPREPPSAGPRA